ncbi:MAG: protein phosphatase 2C domain-containing protein [Lachnospiraceae bacterium]|nr:protein phosphatase 2C domain-containing protein [Lachnospiraceae bacterium]
MRFLSSYHTDIGTRKKSNQDSLLLQQADTVFGPVLLAVVCDGLGGLEKGEVASATVVRAFSDWFQYFYPSLLKKGNIASELRDSWSQLTSTLNTSIADYGRRNGLGLGTTLEALLLAQGRYYIFHIGDCRVYKKERELLQLTKDQTFVQQQIDLGAMTREQAMQDPRKNTLLQCIGASQYIQPDFLEGSLAPGQDFLLCSDGFRHMVTPEEIAGALTPSSEYDERLMTEQLVRLTELDKLRGENDNITSIWVHVA